MISSSAGSSPCVATARSVAIWTGISAVSRRGRSCLHGAEQQRAFKGRVLVVWAREDKGMPPEHAERLSDCFEN